MQKKRGEIRRNRRVRDMKKQPPTPTIPHLVHTCHGSTTIQIPATEKDSHLRELMQCRDCKAVVCVTVEDMLVDYLCNGCVRRGARLSRAKKRSQGV